MDKIPCKLCSSCGLYHDMSVPTCECGADLSQVPGILVDRREIPKERYGEIDPKLPVYVQKCSACGAENFTADPEKRVRICYNCHKTRVAAIEPVLYEGEEEKAEQRAPATSEAEPGQPEPQQAQIVPAVTGAQPVEEAEEEEESSENIWKTLLGSLEETEEAVPAPVPAAAPTPAPEQKRRPSAPPAGDTLTLTAIRYGTLSFTLRAGQPELPLLLGRSASYGDFLRQDPYVGNEHCYLTFRNGNWMVIDNHSTNGTAVNRRFLDYNGEQVLRDGDELMLGHHPTSMAFRVRIS